MISNKLIEQNIIELTNFSFPKGSIRGEFEQVTQSHTGRPWSKQCGPQLLSDLGYALSASVQPISVFHSGWLHSSFYIL